MKIKVPDGMLNAAVNSRNGLGRELGWSSSTCTAILEAALQWLSENPQVPTLNQVDEMRVHLGIKYCAWTTIIKPFLMEWQRRMFMAEDEVPEQLKPLMWDKWQKDHGIPEEVRGWLPIDSHNNQVLAAYKLGQKSRHK